MSSSNTSSKKVGRPKRAKVEALAFLDARYVGAIKDYLAKLHELYPHHNRKVFYDDVVVAYLLAFFNPTVRSLRCIEDMSQLEEVNEHLSPDDLPKSTLSDVNALFDPKHLEGLLLHVRSLLPTTLKHQDSKLDYLLKQLVCFDGSFFKVAGDVEWALSHRKREGAAKNNKYVTTQKHIRLNCAFCEKLGVPVGVSVSGGDGEGEGTAANKLITAADIGSENEHENIFLFDAGVISFDLFSTILNRGDHIVCNLRDQIGFRCLEERKLTKEDQQAGIVSDRVGNLTGSPGTVAPPNRLREIVLNYTDRTGQPRHARILTDLLDLPAHVVAELYRHRWQVELFFRWLKIHANFRHMMSFSRNGVTTSFYIATLAAMLMCLHTNQPLSKYAYNMFAMVANGLARPAEILAILKKRLRERELEKARLARKKAEKQAKNQVV